jgi:hypothetical protein
VNNLESDWIKVEILQYLFQSIRAENSTAKNLDRNLMKEFEKTKEHYIKSWRY